MKQLQLYLPKHKADIGFQGLNIYSPVKKLKMTNIFVALVVTGLDWDVEAPLSDRQTRVCDVPSCLSSCIVVQCDGHRDWCSALR